MYDSKPVPKQQLPQCQVCKLDPVPESSQLTVLLILEVVLMFVNWKLSVIVLMLGYSFPETNWKCSFCNRNVPVKQQNNPTDSIILRMGKCIAMFSLNKFRIFASVVVCYMIYLYASEPKHDPKKTVIKNWQSMVDACGFEVYIQNSVRANRIYDWYLDSGYDWEFEAIFLWREASGIENYQNLYFKMNATQFKDPDAYDFRAFTNLSHGIQLNRGQVIRLKGEWEGRQYHNFIFNPIEVKKTGQIKDPGSVTFFYDRNSRLRSHLDAVKSQLEESDTKSNNKN